MRLEPAEVRAIKDAAMHAFGPESVIRLFGSRLDDHLRGGEIDLHIEVSEGQQDVVHAARFRWDLLGRIDEQKVDLVFQVRGRPPRPIDIAALERGIVL